MSTPTRKPRRESVRKAADYAGMSRATLQRNLIDTGLITVYRAGPKTLRIDLDELDDVMRTNAKD